MQSLGQVTVWWPPAHLKAKSGGTAAQQHAPAATAAPASAPDQGFSAETARILQSLTPAQAAASAPPAAAEGERKEDEAMEKVAAEQLRHPAPVLFLQWSPGGLQGGELSQWGDVYSN